MQAAKSRMGMQYRRWMAALALPLVLAGCNGGGDDDDEQVSTTPPQTAPEQTPPASTEPTRNTVYLDAKAGDVIAVRIEELLPTQAAIGYDQIYYKLGRWQGDFNRSTWQANATQMLDYLNRTVGKKFDDYCEDTGQTSRAQDFQTIAEASAARSGFPDHRRSERRAPGRRHDVCLQGCPGHQCRCNEDGRSGMGWQSVSHGRAPLLLVIARDRRWRPQTQGLGQSRCQLQRYDQQRGVLATNGR
ncbi:ParB-like protein [Bordetella holmesii CDC-H635-BH]|uniref:ParB-like protein n=1 Tax=Bordetella holmesii CDC-H585-BH TaxID=1331206 RepID=A0A158M2U5_9BORD|nr:ParB-like protein [Bordetella holmesii H620]KAK82566.1 ParB-like protein [Bordetella holmesii CDC-H809-BH]KAK85612.1 ParB-like protein [Bordetella holmesii CDC-H572-BH]KAK89835.1 ParB-like protein [Bordetella holmesii CDC-H585-BH]KAL02914.1 ParB-like protein [Bordetella holmesii CDC-H635-BH]KCV01489.1 ParB-like protein [Bordetella holmesii CDC-H629-BH]KCV06021.1 ParB-like protein [Bordetella holmesii CDC-H719-BH]KCV10891.1 ParB-like protein [Bordetella holmesii CDC-H785-BH]KCV12342.1 Par